MKWEVRRARARRATTSRRPTALVAFARAHRQIVRGHTLVWHNQLPAWLTAGTCTDDELAAILQQHITDEVVALPRARSTPGTSSTRRSTRTARLRDTIWLRRARARLHRQGVPLGPPGRPAREALLQRLQHRGRSTPKSDAVLRARAEPAPPGRADRRRRLPGPPRDPVPLSRHAAPTTSSASRRSGVDVAITEADVRMTPAGDPPRSWPRRPTTSAGMLSSCQAVRRCVSFTVWGFDDRHSWVPGVFAGRGRARRRSTRATSPSRRTSPCATRWRIAATGEPAAAVRSAGEARPRLHRRPCRRRRGARPPPRRRRRRRLASSWRQGSPTPRT